MKAALWAKRLDGKGHVYLNTVDIPDQSQEWRVAVRQPIEVRGFIDGGTMITPHITDSVRVFRKQHDPLGRALDKLPRFLEE